MFYIYFDEENKTELIVENINNFSIEPFILINNSKNSDKSSKKSSINPNGKLDIKQKSSKKYYKFFIYLQIIINWNIFKNL